MARVTDNPPPKESQTDADERAETLLQKNANRRTSVVPPRTIPIETTDPWDANTVEELGAAMTEDPAAVLRMIRDLRIDRDEGMAIAIELRNLHNTYETQTENLINTQREVVQTRRQLQLSRAEGAEQVTRILELERTLNDEPHQDTRGVPKSKKSTKLSDPPLFTNGKTLPTWDVWSTKIRDILDVNADHYPTAISQIAFVAGRLDGDAAEHVQSRRREGCPRPYRDVNEVLDHLHGIYANKNLLLTARNEYKSLKMGITESFDEFYSRFSRVTSALPYDETTLMDDLKDRIVRRLQDALVYYGKEFPNLESLKAYLEHIDTTQHSLYLQRQHDKKDSAPTAAVNIRRTTSSIPAATPITHTSTPAVTAALTPVSRQGTPARILTNTTAAEREQLRKDGKCFLCKKVGHMTSTCPDRMTPIQSHELTTSDEPKNE